jgi:hypothetical protein
MNRKKGKTLMLDSASAPHFKRIAACAALFTLLCLPSIAQNDPPDQEGRISDISGTVSILPSGSNDWGQAYQNLPIGPGDRIFTDQDGQAEIQVGQTYLRLGPNSDVTLVNDDPTAIAFGVAQGSVVVHAFGLWQDQSLDLSTPNGDARIGAAGVMRVDSMPDQGATIFSSFGNGLVVTGAGGFFQQLGNWQSLELAGSNPVSPQWLQLSDPDALYQWSQQRDQQIQNASSYQYVSPEVPGAADLDANGDWMPDSDYGPIWFPRGVAIGWQPYHFGHWINHDPWGWVWVEDESWGYAPFHYGRWVSYRGRWGWIPGARDQHPVWSPALVVFAGGINFGGVGVAAWFPLGPGEAYRPWYPTSPRYIDRINITNIHESRTIHVQTTYIDIVNVHNTNITYVNRSIGASAMRQDDFAAGRPVRQAAVAVDKSQFDRVQAINTPAPVTRQSFVARPVAHPVPVSGIKPVFINRQGMQISNRPGAPPVQAPVRPVPPIKAIPGRAVVAPPQNSRFQNSNSGNPQRAPAPVGRPLQPVQGRQMNMPNQPAAPANNPPASTNYRQDFGTPQQNKPRETEPASPPANNPTPERPAPQQPRPTPPPPQPVPQPREDSRPAPPQPESRPTPPPEPQHEARPTPPSPPPQSKPNKDQQSKPDKDQKKKDDKKKDN